MKYGVLHLVDTLEFGGAEKVAVNYVNHLPLDRFRPFLGTTRRSGPLEAQLAPHVQPLHLNRRSTFDLTALHRLRRFIATHRIALVHAHGSTLFLSRMLQLTMPGVAVVWHLHYGRWADEDRRDWRWALASRGVQAAVTSNDQLAEWLKRRFPIPSARVMHLRNIVDLPRRTDAPHNRAPRIVCVANLRPEKDHLTLIESIALLVRHHPELQLLLAGTSKDPATVEAVRQAIARHSLESNIVLLGPSSDVPGLLAQCDIGVLSSTSEGLPVALLEYGAAGLPVVSTNVGQCASVLEEGRAGFLVNPRSPADLSNALRALIQSSELRAQLGAALRRHVEANYSPAAVMHQLCGLYDRVLVGAS